MSSIHHSVRNLGMKTDVTYGVWLFPLIAYKYQITIVVYGSDMNIWLKVKSFHVLKKNECFQSQRTTKMAQQTLLVDMASTIFLVHKHRIHYLHLSVPADIQELSDEYESVMEESEQRGESNSVVIDDKLVGSTTL
jgi:hypothetical protein